ncbi:MAG: ABC transporter substrate-binding protein [Acidobacteria bacterium]|jgi:ABC-type transport system substrate-binding protein|nr:ABC transporter substrate-binding protein [Acidobacteriota bacterium]
MGLRNGIGGLAAALLLLLALPGCSRPERETAGVLGPKGPQLLRALIVPQPGSLLPHEGTYYVEGQLSDAIFNNLVCANHMGSLAPELAENWEVSPDHRQYTFHLRRGVRFHDGRPFTAADVVFTLENLIEKSRGKFAEIEYIDGYEDFLARRTSHVRGIRMLDEHTVQVRLNSGFKFFLPFLAAEYAAIVPAAFAGKSEEDFRWHPLGTGPYRLARTGTRTVDARQYLVFSLEKNRTYFAATGNVDAIDLYTTNTSIDSASTRHFDLLFISDSEMPELSGRPEFKILNSSPSILNFLVLNPGENDWMSRVEVRQLVYFAINREKLVREVFHNQAMPAHSMIPFGLLGHNPYYRLDYARAAAIRATLPPGRISFTLLTVAKDRRGQVGEFVRRELARFDIDVKVITMDDQYDYFTRRIYDTDASVVMGGIPDYPSSFHFLSHLVEPNGYYNIRRFSLPALQASIKTLPSLDTVNEARVLAEISASCEREALYVPLYHYSNFVAIRDRIRSISFKYGEVADLARLEVIE